MNSRELEYILEFKQKLKQECSCKGMIPFCTCDSLIKLETKKIEAGIPLKYLSFTFEDITRYPAVEAKIQILKYLDEIDFNFKNGFGLFLYGSRGFAKTVLGVLTLITLLEKSYSIFFTSLDKYLEGTLRNNEDYLQKIRERNFVMIDGLGSEVLPESGIMGNCLENLLRTRGDKLNPLIITSNKNGDELEKYFKIPFKNLLGECFLQIQFGDK